MIDNPFLRQSKSHPVIYQLQPAAHNPTVWIKSKLRQACWFVLIRNRFLGKLLFSLRLEDWKQWSISRSQTQFTALPAHHSSRRSSRKKNVDLRLRCSTVIPTGPGTAVWEASSSYTERSSAFLESYIPLMPLRLSIVLLDCPCHGLRCLC